jgi:hypothetical protein
LYNKEEGEITCDPQRITTQKLTEFVASANKGEGSSLSSTPFGEELAAKVAKKLPLKELVNNHNGYGGNGLGFSDGSYFYYVRVDSGVKEIGRKFDTKESFVSWLTNQSDRSLGFCGYNKDAGELVCDRQRITLQKLETFVSDH